DKPNEVVPGRLLLTGGRPRLELNGALSPFVREVSSGTEGVRKFVPAAIPAPRTIHGNLLGPVSKVTLLHASQVSHHAKSPAMPSTVNQGPQQEVLEA